APRALRRGPTVSAASSSPLKTRAAARPGPGLPSGEGRPGLRRAERAGAVRGLPRAGSPSRVGSVPRGRGPRPNQGTGRVTTSLNGRMTRDGSSGGGVDMAGSVEDRESGFRFVSLLYHTSVQYGEASFYASHVLLASAGGWEEEYPSDTPGKVGKDGLIAGWKWHKDRELACGAVYTKRDLAVAKSAGRWQRGSYVTAEEQLPQTMRTEWTELALLQLQTGNTAMWVFLMAVVLVFLVLAAQYESWSLPLAVILVVPIRACG